MLLKDTYKLGNNNDFNLIVYYDPDASNPWTKIKIGKSIKGREDSKYLRDNNAAILKLLLDQARINGSYIGPNDLPENWPRDDYKIGFTYYRAIRNFLGEYSYRLKTQNARNGGVCFDLANVVPITGENVTAPIETIQIKKEDSIPKTHPVSTDSYPDINSDKKAIYNILILDDSTEILEMLEQSLNSEIDKDDKCPYKIRIISVSKSTDAIVESNNTTIDVYVFDVVRGVFLSSQVSPYDYFGFDLIRLLLREKPNIQIKSKFYIFSKLPAEIVRKEFEGTPIEYYSKITTSPHRISEAIKQYLDDIYLREMHSNER